MTRPRLAVLSAVHAHPHADTDSIIGFVRQDLGVVSHQAVYDALRALTDAGLVPGYQITEAEVIYWGCWPTASGPPRRARPLTDPGQDHPFVRPRDNAR